MKSLPRRISQSLRRYRKRLSRRKTRYATMEVLEPRLVMASRWQNPCNALDVTNDGFVSPIDALLPINRINEVGSGDLPNPPPLGNPPPYYDVSGDQKLVPLDVLLIINALNQVSLEQLFQFEGQPFIDLLNGNSTHNEVTTSDPYITGSLRSLLGLQSFQARVDGGAAVAVQHMCGSFTFDTGLALDGSADGPHVATFHAKDPLNREAAFDVAFTLQTQFRLEEGSNFDVEHQRRIVIPSEPSTLEVRYRNLEFDTSSDFVKDAFEATLIDNRGQSLVHPISGLREAFFNITEGEPPIVGVNARHSGGLHSDGLLEVDLSHIPPGTLAMLVERLVNNDADTTTSVTITGLKVVPRSLETPLGVTPASIAAADDPDEEIDFDTLSDVATSINLQYGRTSLHAARDALFADFSLANVGSYAVDGPLLVVVDSLSDPTIAVQQFDGLTPDGKPFLRLDDELPGGTLDPGETTDQRTLTLLNPSGVQFGYELKVLAQLNRSPTIVSQPPEEALVDKPYRYQFEVEDLDDDVLVYSLITAPEGMQIGSATGTIDWTPAVPDVGTHSVSVRAKDESGAAVEQTFTLAVRQDVPNRPPQFTSEPVVAAEVAGSFEVVEVLVGKAPAAVAVGDFTGDGPLSLVSANPGDQTVTVVQTHDDDRFENRIDLGIGEPPPNLSRTFIEPLTVDVGFPIPIGRANDVTSIATGDFNRDGHLDLAANLRANRAAPDAHGLLAILFSNGDGTFQPPKHIAMPTNPVSTFGLGLLSKDFDGDGKLDLVSAVPVLSQILFFKGDGNGNFADPVASNTGGQPTRVQVADFNGDSKLDLVTVNENQSTASVLLGNGNGTFGNLTTYTVGSYSRDIALADMDGVNGLDLVVASVGEGSVHVRLNDGTGAFGSAIVTAATNPLNHLRVGPVTAIHVADFDGDGKPDVVTAFDTGGIGFHKGLGNGTFATAIAAVTQPMNYFPAHWDVENIAPDLNGDGRPDLLFGRTGGYNVVTIGLSRGDGTFDLREYLVSPGPAEVTQPRQGADFPSVLASDFNSDGVIDLAAAARGTNSGVGGLSILLGETPGTFRSPRAYIDLRCCTGSDAALVDLNNDRRLDLATLAHPIDVHLGQGDGTFGPAFAAMAQLPPGTADQTRDLRTADFDRDGNQDVTFIGQARHLVAFGLGDGTLGAPRELFIGGQLRVFGTGGTNLVVQDFNGDGYPDLAARIWSHETNLGHLEIWLYDPAGRTFNLIPDAAQRLFLSFTSQDGISHEVGYGLVTADFDGDDIADLVAHAGVPHPICCPNLPERLFFFKGKRTAAPGDVADLFDAPTVVNTAVGHLNDLVAADFNRDGKTDFAGTGPFNGDQTHVFLGLGDGTFAAPVTYPVGDEEIQSGDVNGDGHIDLLVGRAANGDPPYSWATLIGRGDGTFLDPEIPAGIRPGIPSIASRDIDGDGKADVVEREHPRGSIGYTSVAFLSSKPGLQAVATGDVNRDGKRDILAANAGNGHVKVLLGSGDNTFIRQHDLLVGRGPVALLAANLDSDNNLDIITANQFDDSITILRGTGGGAFTRTDLPAGDMPASLALGELSGDGKSDIVVANAASQSVTIYVNQGNGSFAAGVHIPAGDAPHSIAIGDATGDGINDLVISNPSSDRVTIMPGRGDSTFGTAVLVSAGDEPTGLAVGDLNQDGKPEIIVSNPNDDHISILFGRGSGRFSRPQAIRVGDSPAQLSLDDVNRDGLLDVVVANAGGDSVSVVFNRFDPTKVYVYQATATDPDGDPLTFALVDGPGGMLLDEMTGRTVWAPTADQLGPNAVTLEVSDGRGGSASQSFVVHVAQPTGSHPPLLTSQPETQILSTQTYEDTLRAADADGDHLRYSKASGPEGMSIHPVSGQITWDPRSSALSFDGNDFVQIPHDASIDPRRTITLELWMRAESFAVTWMPLVQKGNGVTGGGRSYSLWLNQNGYIYASSSDGTEETISTPAGTIQLGRWHHIAAVFDRGKGEMQIFIDGNLAASGSVRQTDTVAHTQPLLLAKTLEQFGGVGPFRGQLDEVRLWNVAREPTAIQADMFRALTGCEPGMVGHWRFEETDFLAVRDSSPSVNDGTLSDGRFTNFAPKRTRGIAPSGSHPVTVRVEDTKGMTDEINFVVDVIGQPPGALRGTVFNTAIIDRALQFDGNDFVEFPDSPSLHSDRALTISGWFKSDGFVREWQNIIFKGELPDVGNQGTREYGLWLNRAGYLYFASTPADRVGVRELTLQTSSLIRPGRWYHFAVVIDSDGQSMRLYVDGEPAAEGAYNAAGIRDTAAPLRIGQSPPWDSYFFGAIDEVRMYNSARTQAHILAEILGVPTGAESDLAAYWNFDETAGVAILDASNFQNAGTLGGDGLGTDLPTRFTSDVPGADSVLKGRTIYIDRNRNGVRDPGEVSANADASGHYVIADLAPGTHSVAEEGLPGWLITSPLEGRATVQVVGGQTAILDFQNNQLNATAGERTPRLISVAPTSAEIGSMYRYASDVSNPDGRPVTFDLPVKPDGMVVDSAGVVAWVPNHRQLGSQRVLLRVKDDRGLVDIQDITLEVHPGNTAPVITSTAHPSAIQSLPYRYQVLAQDAEESDLHFALELQPPGMTIDADTGRIDWTPTAGDLGARDVTVVVDDGRGGEARQAYVVTVVANSANRAPLITSTPRTAVRLGSHYFYQIDATDADLDRLTFELVTGPTGMSVSSDGLVTWPRNSQQLGAHAVSLRVFEGRGGEATQDFTLQVTTQGVNQLPQFVSTPVTSATVGRLYAYDLQARDPDGDPLIFTLDQGPLGLSLDPARGTLRWRPDATQLGQAQVIVHVMDPFGGEAVQEFTMIARGASSNLPPMIVSAPQTETAVGKSYLYAVSASDAEGDVLNFSLPVAPAGMTIEPQSGDIAWTPTTVQVGTNAVIVHVSDARGAFATQAFEVVVLAGSPNEPPVITSPAPLVATVGEPFTYTIQATDPEGQTPRFEKLRGPAGVTVDPISGQVQWLPSAADLGVVPLTFAAVDSGNAAGVQSFEVTVMAANNAPQIRSTAPQRAAAGAAYRYDVTATDLDREPLAFQLTTAPSGMTVDPFGRIRWQTAVADIGLHNVTVQVRDSRGAIDTQEFQVTVEADTIPPRVAIIPDRPLYDVGETMLVRVTATDNVSITSLDFSVAGVAVPLDAQGRAAIPVLLAGFPVLRASARDASGNTGTASVTVRFRNQFEDAGNVPTVSITSPAADAAVSGIVDIIGTASDNTLREYKLLVRRADQQDFTEIASGRTSVTEGVLGRWDTTLLENDSYVLRLQAVDDSGNEVFIEQNVGVSGELKLGNFRLSFTDLTIPVSGIPITVARTYDTLRSDREGDFGFGWRMEFRNADLRTSLPKSGLEDLGIHTPFRPGTRVYVTLPGGRREGYTFTPDIRVLPGFGENLVIATTRFTPDRGVTNTLSVPSATLIVNEFGELFSGGGQPYNPAAEEFGGGYTVTSKNGNVYRLDGTTGKLRDVTDTNSNRLTFDDTGVHSSTGKEVTFQRDARGRITAVIDAMENALRYEYNAAGDLISVTDREGNVTRFEYRADRPHYLERVIDPLARTGLRTDYDSEGRLTTIYDVNGNPIELQSDPNAHTQTVLDRQGDPVIIKYDERGNVTRSVDHEGREITRTFDVNNNLLTEKDQLGFTAHFSHDSAGNLLAFTNPLGQTTRFAYGPFGRVKTKTDPFGNTFTVEFDTAGNVLSSTDPLGNVIAFQYDSSGNISARTEAGDHVTRFEYDSAGNRIKETNALGHTTHFTFDANGNERTRSYVVTMPSGPRTLVNSITYNQEDRPIEIKDTEGGVRSFEYDPLGNVNAVTDETGRRFEARFEEATVPAELKLPSGATAVTRFNEDGVPEQVTLFAGETYRIEYDSAGNPSALLGPRRGDPSASSRTEFGYDAAGLVTTLTDAAGGVVRFKRDAARNIVEIKNGQGETHTGSYDAAGRLIAETAPLGRTRRHKYDALGRLVETVFPDGTIQSRSYDFHGRVLQETDATGKTTRYEYDSLGRLTAVVDPLRQRTEYAYDEIGNLVSRKDANGNATRFEYDAAGRLVGVTLPMGQRATAKYDAAGRLVQQTDLNGNVTILEYDRNGNLSAKRFANGTSVVLAYDPSGRLDSATQSDGRTQFAYDIAGRLQSRTNPDGTTISYTYTDTGLLESIHSLSGFTSYTYEPAGRLKSVRDPEGRLTSYHYNAAGNVIRSEFPNGTREIREYDDRSRPTLIQTTGPNGVISSYRYIYSPTGLQLSVTDQNDRRVSYAYDDANRLVQEVIFDPSAVPRTISYEYNAVGNRLRREDSVGGVTTYHYDRNDRLLSETQGSQVTRYTYDDNGNVLSKEVDASNRTTYEWDPENHLVGVTVVTPNGNRQVSYGYDVSGIRTSQSIDGVETRYLIAEKLPLPQVVEEYSPQGVVQTFYIYGVGLVSQERSEETTYYAPDAHGNTRRVTDGIGNVVAAYDYDAFGRLISPLPTLENIYLYAGQQRDFVTGLDYLRARYMETDNGRFISSDPFEGDTRLPVTYHRYLYAHNDPVNLSDPTGTFVEVLAGLAVSIGIIGGLLFAGQSVYLGGVDASKLVEWKGTITQLQFEFYALQAASGLPIPVALSGMGALAGMSSGVYKGDRGTGTYGLIAFGGGIGVPTGFAAGGTIGSMELKVPAALSDPVNPKVLQGGILFAGLSVVAGVNFYSKGWAAMGLGRGVQTSTLLQGGGLDLGFSAFFGLSVLLEGNKFPDGESISNPQCGTFYGLFGLGEREIPCPEEQT